MGFLISVYLRYLAVYLLKMKVFLAFLAVAAVLYTVTAELEEEGPKRKFKNVPAPKRMLTGVNPNSKPKLVLRKKFVVPKIAIKPHRILVGKAAPKKFFRLPKIVAKRNRLMVGKAAPRKFSVPK